ncbi:MAG: Gfo/Idh/MocA family protein [Opitutales bacterium]
MKRRTFIQDSLILGAACSLTPSGLWGSSTKNSTMQLAQIGCGRMGRGDMKNALNSGWKEGNNARVIAVCDVDLKRANDSKNIVTEFYTNKGEAAVKVDVYQDFRELLMRNDIDGVVISTPDNWHGIIGVMAANAGKHIYLQKPLAYSIPEGKALVKAVRANNVVLQTGSQQRSMSRFFIACNVVRNNWLGQLKEIQVELPTDKGVANGEPSAPPSDLNYDLWLGPCPDMPYIESRVHPQNGYGRPGWLQVERFCLGMITGWGSHMYDIGQWAMGTDRDSGPVEIQAKGEFPDRGHFNVHVDYQGEALYSNGVRMTSNNGKPGVRFVTEDGWVYCSRGALKASDKEILRRRPTGDEISLYQSRNHMSDFITSARDGSDPVCPVEVGHRSNTICVLHHISMKLGGRKLKWDPVSETIVGDAEASALMNVPMRDPWTV